MDVDAIEVIATPASLTPGTIADDFDALWKYYGTWTTQSGITGPYAGTVHNSAVAGNSAQILVSGGQQIKLTYTGNSTRGKTDIYIDGAKVATIDMYSPSLKWQQTWTSDILTTGLHSVRFVKTTSSPTDIDAIEVIASPASLAPGTVADDTSTVWKYYGTWTTQSGLTGPYAGTVHNSSILGNSAQVLVSGGQRIKLTYTGNTTRGKVDVYIDGSKVATIDMYSATLQRQKTWTSGTLSAGLHSVRFVHATASPIDVDAIEVLP